MDFFIVRAFVESIRRNISPPIDVYDAASLSVISPLSEKSMYKKFLCIAASQNELVYTKLH